MFHLLGILFIIIIAVLLIGLSILGSVLRSIFGLGKRRSTGTYQNGQSARGYNSNQHQNNTSSNEETETPNQETSKRKKLFTKEDGEYVDYEEIKDN